MSQIPTIRAPWLNVSEYMWSPISYGFNIKSLNNHYYLCWMFWQDICRKSKWIMNRDSPDTSHCPLGETLMLRIRLECPRYTCQTQTQTIINTTHRNSREETQTARDHLRTRSGLYYFTFVHYHQTYSVDLLTFCSLTQSKRMTDKPCYMSALLQP